MEKIQMLHPVPGKKTIAMDKAKYDRLKQGVLKCFKEKNEYTFKQLLAEVTNHLQKEGAAFEGSIEWHLAWVTTDMEAREELKINRSISPQVLVLN